MLHAAHSCESNQLVWSWEQEEKHSCPRTTFSLAEFPSTLSNRTADEQAWLREGRGMQGASADLILERAISLDLIFSVLYGEPCHQIDPISRTGHLTL